MDTTTVNQLIDTGGIVLIGLAAICTYWWVSNVRKVIRKEKELLLDCLFYRRVVGKYMERVKELGDGNLYRTFRSEAQKELGYKNSSNSEIAKIMDRLKYLARSDAQLAELMNKISLG